MISLYIINLSSNFFEEKDHKRHQNNMNENKNPADFFPYIGHEINHPEQYKQKMYKLQVGSLYTNNQRQNVNEDRTVLKGDPNSFYQTVEINGLSEGRKIADNPRKVTVVTPRHKSLYDYLVGQPVHHELLNPEVMLLAGNNLFILKYDQILRYYGGMMILREDTWLKKKGLPKVYLTQKDYFNEVFPAYLRQEMIDGVPVDGKKIRRDLIIYPEQEKHPVTGKRGGGRTKTGKMRNLSHLLFDKIKSVVRDTDTKLYITPANISYSKIPDMPYIVYPNTAKGLAKQLRYFLEQYTVYIAYAQYAQKHPEAKLDAVVNYGKPYEIHFDDFSSMRDLLKFSNDLKDKMGQLESIFPLKFLYRALDGSSESTVARLEENGKALFDLYCEKNIHVEKISDSQGNLRPIKELIDESLPLINANPNFHIKEIKRKPLLTFENGELKSHDTKIQSWYANLVKHLD